jgi:hypothetical protein
MIYSLTSAIEIVEQADVVADAVIVEGPAAGPMAQQFRAQFEPMLKVELSFVNRVSKLSDEERKNLITKGNAWLKKFIADYAKQGGQPQAMGVWMANGRRQVNDPRESIQAGVAKLVKAELPKEKAKKYAEEGKKRAEFNKRAFVDNLVMRIDNELILSPEQRDKIAKSLTEQWDKNWQSQLDMFVHGMDMWPAVPDQWIRPHLSPVQQIAWGRLNKQQGHAFFGGFAHQGQVIDDIDLKEGQAADKAENEAAAGDQPAPAVFAVPIGAF